MITVRNMLSISYAIGLQLRETLHEIDSLRTQILDLPASIKTENKIAWEAMATRIWATLTLDGYDAPKQLVTGILAHPQKPTKSVARILGLKNVYDSIHQTWRANPKPVPLTALESLFTALYPPTMNFADYEVSLKEILSYLEAKQEHPVIQAALGHGLVLSIPGFPEPGLLARSFHYLLLAKNGYDIRGYIAPDRQWAGDPAYGHLALPGVDGSSTQWIEYIAGTMHDTLSQLLKDMQESRFHIDFPPSFWELSDRQKEILSRLTNPEEKVTNRQVQREFNVSQITASRDLAKLVSLGLLYPHGKGRSVYYTKL